MTLHFIIFHNCNLYHNVTLWETELQLEDTIAAFWLYTSCDDASLNCNKMYHVTLYFTIYHNSKWIFYMVTMWHCILRYLTIPTWFFITQLYLAMWLYLYLAVATHILIIATLYLRIYHYISCDVGSRDNYHMKLYFINLATPTFLILRLYLTKCTQFLIIATLSKNVKLCFMWFCSRNCNIITIRHYISLYIMSLYYISYNSNLVSHNCDYLAMWLSFNCNPVSHNCNLIS